MASMGLLGAIGGLGDALQTAGTNLATRRERALEQARQLAAEERKRAQQLSDKKEERLFTLTRDDALQTRQDARTAAQIASQEGRAQLSATTRERVADKQISAADARAAASREHQTSLVRLREQLQGARTAAEIRLRDRLANDDVAGTKFGKEHPNRPGMFELVIIRKDGSLKKTGEWVNKHRIKPEDDDDSL